MAPFEHVSRPTRLAVESFGVAAQECADKSRERLFACLDRDVNVVRHPAIGMNMMFVLLQSLTKKFFPVQTIITVQKDILLSIAAHVNVVIATRHMQSR